MLDDLLAAGIPDLELPGYEPFTVTLSMLLTPTRTGIARVRLLAEFQAGIIGDILSLCSVIATRTFAAGI